MYVCECMRVVIFFFSHFEWTLFWPILSYGVFLLFCQRFPHSDDFKLLDDCQTVLSQFQKMDPM